MNANNCQTCSGRGTVAWEDDIDGCVREDVCPDCVCEACGGSGVIVHACQTYEHGCGFSHADSYETLCDVCGGSGVSISAKGENK